MISNEKIVIDSDNHEVRVKSEETTIREVHNDIVRQNRVAKRDY